MPNKPPEEGEIWIKNGKPYLYLNGKWKKLHKEPVNLHSLLKANPDTWVTIAFPQLPFETDEQSLAE